MSESIDSIRTQLWNKMRSKEYRDNFVAAHLAANTAAQIQTLREAQQMAQKELAEKAGMKPARISLLENPSYDKHSISTLKRLASAFDVALIVRFVPFSELVEWVADLSPARIGALPYERDGLRETSGLPKRAQLPSFREGPLGHAPRSALMFARTPESQMLQDVVTS